MTVANLSRMTAEPGTGAFGAPAAPEPGPAHGDKAIADAVVAAVRDLNAAIERAVKAGLIVEPVFSKVQNRFDDPGGERTSYAASIRIYRKLC